MLKYLVGAVCKGLSNGLAGKVCVYVYTYTCIYTDRCMCIQREQESVSPIVC